MPRVLFVLDELPYPPRCGVTNTTFPLMTGLLAANEVSVLWLRHPGQVLCAAHVEECRHRFKNVWVADLQPRSRIRAGFNELIGAAPYFGSASLDLEKCRDMLSGYDCDIVWCSPIRPLAYASAIEGVLPIGTRRTRVAAINDSYTATLRARGRQVWGRFWAFRDRIGGAAGWARSYCMAPMENRLLQTADCILVQTDMDRQWVHKVTHGRLDHATHVVPNGANPELLHGPAPTATTMFGHAGTLNQPSSVRTVRWLLNEVLPAICRVRPTTTLSVLGAPGPADLMHQLTRHPSVRYRPRVETMREFFSDVPILIVRNYKNIGLITRTIDAMSAGVVVIGEPGAFNGIRRFRPGVHGFVAERTCDVVDILSRLFSGGSLITEVSQAARALIQEDFRREDRLAFVQRLLENLLLPDHPRTPWMFRDVPLARRKGNDCG